jgi:hypothetical protein
MERSVESTDGRDEARQRARESPLVYRFPEVVPGPTTASSVIFQSKDTMEDASLLRRCDGPLSTSQKQDGERRVDKWGKYTRHVLAIRPWIVSGGVMNLLLGGLATPPSITVEPRAIVWERLVRQAGGGRRDESAQMQRQPGAVGCSVRSTLDAPPRFICPSLYPPMLGQTTIRHSQMSAENKMSLHHERASVRCTLLNIDQRSRVASVGIDGTEPWHAQSGG